MMKLIFVGQVGILFLSIVSFFHVSGYELKPKMINANANQLAAAFRWHQRKICNQTVIGMNVKYVYFNFGLYTCTNGQFQFHSCFLPNGKILYDKFSTEFYIAYGVFKNHITNDTDINYCSQLNYLPHSHKQTNIWNVEKILCKSNDLNVNNNEVIAAYYNFKFVFCENGKFKLAGCLFQNRYAMIESISESHLSLPHYHVDVCLRFGNQYKNVIDKTLYRLNGYDGKGEVDGLFDLKNFHSYILCTKYRLKNIFYEFGHFKCKRGRLKLKSCMFGYKEVNISTAKQKIQSKNSGDYIDDENDLKFCAQIASDYLASDRTNDQENMWKHKDNFCGMYQESNMRHNTYGLYHNFKVFKCSYTTSKVYLKGCLYNTHSVTFSDVSAHYNRSNNPMDYRHRDFCFDYGSEFGYIYEYDVDQKKEEFENGLQKTCIIRKWTNNLIPYYINRQSMNQLMVNRIYQAMQKYESRTCVRFKELTMYEHLSPRWPNNVYITAKLENNWTSVISPVGMKGGLQYLLLENFNIYAKIARLIGLENEHQRPDRDNYVKLNAKNILNKFINYFHYNEEEVYNEWLYACRTYHSTGKRYTYSSVTHQVTSSSKDSWMKTRSGGLVTKGTKNALDAVHESDFEKINRFYGC